MNELRFEAEILRGDATPVDVVRERVYGGVRVSAEWPEDLETLGDADRRNAPAYVELFFHDVFLLLNLSSPGSFGGTISVTGIALRVRELTLDPRVFEYARAPRVNLNDVVRWYDGLRLATQQVASTPEAIALFRLLQLACGEEDEETAVLRLASAAEALLGRTESLQRLFALRDQIARGSAPVFHPMHDDGLDPRVEDATREWIDIVDEAASIVIAELQERVRKSAV
jgi:hypothetical protein